MIKSTCTTKKSNTFIPSFNKKVFDIQAFQDLFKLHQTELLATVVFSYITQMDNPLTIFASDPSCLDESDTITKELFIDEAGEIRTTESDATIFVFSVDLNIKTLHDSVGLLLESNPDASQEQIGLYSYDAFLLQVVPKIWDQAQLLLADINSAVRSAWQTKAVHYAAGSGHSPYTLYEKILTPLISMMAEKKKGLH